MKTEIVKAETGNIAQPTLTQVVDSFISSQDVKPSSKALYIRTLKQYFTWINKKEIDLSQVTRIEILQYKQDLLDSGLSPLTVGSYITVVRKFYEWAEDGNISKNIRIRKTDHFNQYLDDNPESRKWLTQRRFAQWIGDYAMFKDYRITEGKDQIGRWVTVEDKPSKEDVTF